MLYEPWAMSTDVSTAPKTLEDPDQPLQALTKTSVAAATASSWLLVIAKPVCGRS